MMAQALPGLLALLVAGALALAGRRWPAAAILALGTGVLAGWWWLFGTLPASPRQLPERLPLLALAILVSAGLAATSPRARWVLAAIGVAGTGWWMGGAPRNLADLRQAAPVILAVALFAAVAGLSARGRAAGLRAILAAAVLWAGLALAGPPGPAALLALVLLCACLGAALGPRPGLPGLLPFATALAALAALPVLARGAPVDWVVALAPLLALLPWPRGLAIRRRGR